MSVDFVHLTDLHLSHPDNDDPNLHSDTVANLRAMIARLRQITPQPAFVVISGDLTNQGDTASYRLLRDMLADLPMPVIHALGNHDNRAAFRAVFADIVGDASSPDAPYYHHAVQGGVQIITLDTSVPGRVGGRICDEQFTFLEQALRAAPDLAKLLVIHHPPLICKTALAWESLDRNDSDRLATALRGHNVAGILSGHIHVNRVSHWHGIPVILCNGLHATIDVLKPSGMRIEEGTGFGYCSLGASGITVSFVPLTPERPILGEISDDLLRSFR